MYFVFAGTEYSPNGGANDHRATFDIQAEAFAYAQGLHDGGEDWVHVATVVDGKLKIIWADGIAQPDGRG